MSDETSWYERRCDFKNYHYNGHDFAAIAKHHGFKIGIITIGDRCGRIRLLRIRKSVSQWRQVGHLG